MGQNQHLKGEKLTDAIVELISKCSIETDTNPDRLDWNFFQKWLAEHDGNLWIGSIEIGRAGGFKNIRDAYFPPVPDKEIVDFSRIKEHARVNRKLAAKSVQERFLAESIEELSRRVFKGRISSSPVLRLASGKKTSRIVNAVLSDLHFGADLKNQETGTDYGRVEESRRAAAVFEQIAEYKMEHRSETELELLILGDIIQGQLHDPRDGAVLAEQVCRAIHILSQGIGFLSVVYKKIRVRCSPGNHGRNIARHPDRATNQKWDSNENIAYYAIKMACSGLKNVEFFIPKTPWVEYPVFNNRVFATHGDTVLNIGNPGNQIKVSAIERQVNRINASLPDSQEYSVFVLGHVHVGSVSHLPNGSVVVTNGTLMPQDSFAVSIGLIESVCGQYLWESVPGHPFGDSRFIVVNKSHDIDQRLDKIIKPWSNL